MGKNGDVLDVLARIFNPTENELETIRASLKRFPLSHRKRVGEAIKEAHREAPRIALIGKTGVGKSSTINALFRPHPLLKIGHVRATTRKICETRIPLGDHRGDIIVIDCPGLGESIQADEETIPAYEKLLARCDVALWILKADDRVLAQDQSLILRVLPSGLKKRLVVGINQIDLMQPGKWCVEYNLPAREQERSIESKVRDVKRKLGEVGIKPKFVVPYSALYSYRLTQLFTAILDACPTERAWVLSSREKISPYQAPSFSDRGA